MAMVLSLVLLVSAVGAFAESEALTFEDMASLSWSFSSGAGGWSTDMQILEDGSFIGTYHDSEMGEMGDGYPNGTIYICSFEGQMTILEQVDEYSWKIRVDSLTLDDEPGQETIDEDIRFVTSELYGLSEGDEMTVYLPGTPVDVFTDDMRMWAHLFDVEEQPEAFEDWFMYSEANESGFVGYPAAYGFGLANPWVEMTEEELLEASGVSFGVPEDADDIVYRWLESENLAEMQFSIGGDEFCARIMPAALEAGELMNIAGMYFAWENEEDVTVGHCYGTIGQAKTGSEDWVELCQWYDLAPGLMYSLAVSTTDPDGLDLVAVAEMVYVPMQGDA
jgi:hypothetical protein